MAIDVEIQDEKGNRLASYDGPPLGTQLLKLAPAKSVCFRFIVPWGDTTFNEEQIKVLQDELDEAMTNTTDAERLRELKAITSFIKEATGAHVYVKFIGD